MGGSALKKVQTRRLAREEYFRVQAKVMEMLKLPIESALQSMKKPDFYFSRFVPVRSYENKPDFGDMDILVSKPKPEYKDLEAFLKANFDTKQVSPPRSKREDYFLNAKIKSKSNLIQNNARMADRSERRRRLFRVRSIPNRPHIRFSGGL